MKFIYFFRFYFNFSGIFRNKNLRIGVNKVWDPYGGMTWTHGGATWAPTWRKGLSGLSLLGPWV